MSFDVTRRAGLKLCQGVNHVATAHSRMPLSRAPFPDRRLVLESIDNLLKKKTKAKNFSAQTNEANSADQMS